MPRLLGSTLGFLLTVFFHSGFADTLEAPTGPVLLSVSGAIDTTNVANKARFDRAMLTALGTSSVTTKTPWSDRVSVYEGVLAETVLKRLGAEGHKVVAVALNDYKVEIPLSDFAKHGVLLAMRRDGKNLSIRDKGPIFVIYPFDDNPELWNEQIFSRCIWQLSRLEIY